MSNDLYLIVEDNMINQKILSTYLKIAGYKYDVANNGLEAIQKINNNIFKLIFMYIY